MSRETYQIPTPSQTANPGSSSGGGLNPGAQRSPFDADTNTVMQYICGDCGAKCPLRRNELIRCRECGCRVLYKERTKRMVQFEAR
ncbi:metallothionein-I transcription activator [Hypoxylon rubiginosum]|uniref:Metallothionein-I transcription activator n=1 Tax=Hypoxylon rubiginosum TaxID=110542 RepID=A0ACB9YY83_9PEZI|nr:metallothionein-I transcription activator [Hypoxylon rubiginosum]